LRLTVNALIVSGDLTNTATAGDFQVNNLGVTIDGLTTLSGGTFQAGAAPLSFLGGLTINGGAFTAATGTVDIRALAISAGSFTGALGAINTAGVALSGGALVAPAGTLTDSGDWTVSGSGVFLANGGTVAFSGAAQNLTSDGQAFANLTHSGAGTLALQDALTVNAILNVAAGTLDLNGHDIQLGD